MVEVLLQKKVACEGGGNEKKIVWKSDEWRKRRRGIKREVKEKVKKRIGKREKNGSEKGREEQ